MFFSLNYTVEAFLWIIIGAIFLVSLTIFMARPKPPSEEPKDFVKHDLKGSLTSGSGTRDKEIIDEEEEVTEEAEPSEYTDIKNPVDNRYTAAIAVLLLIIGSLFVQSTFDTLFRDDPSEDSDNDGLTNVEEKKIGTDPFDSDTDNDGLDDGEEVNTEPYTNPLDDDTDDDGLTDIEESEIGTDPNSKDTDDDGLTDIDEIENNTDPLDSDSDDDGLSDYDEIENGTDPIDDQVGNSLYFNGAEDHVYIGDPDDGSLDFGTGAFSYSVWIKTTDGGSSKSDGGQILCKRGGGGNYEMRMHEGGHVGANYVSTASSLDDGEWHNIVFTHELRTARIYVDGQWEASGIMPDEGGGTYFSGDGPLRIGADSYQGENFRGYIDEVAFWNTRLSSSDIFALYHYGRGLDASVNSGDYNSSSNLSGYWKFVENHGTEVADASPNNNVGTIYGADWSTDSPKICALVPYGHCSGIDLVGGYLSAMSLTGIHLNHARLSGADLSDADLRHANLGSANLSYANLSGANLGRVGMFMITDLTNANLYGADLTGADLSYADLTGTDLTGADLTGANLTGVDLTDANLQYSYLANAYLQYADLAGTNFYYADLNNANLNNANLTNAVLSNTDLTNTNLAGADLNGANLSDAFIWNAYLRYANLTNADLTNARLDYADLRSADLSYAYLTGADLTGADLTGATLTHVHAINLEDCPAQLPDEWQCVGDSFPSMPKNLIGPSANLENADLIGANLTGADLTDAYLTGANLNGADLTDAYLGGATLKHIYATYLDGCPAQLPDEWQCVGDENFTQIKDALDLVGPYANLYSTSFHSENLSYANLTYADLSFADLSDANLSYADLTAADLTNADLTGAIVTDADFTDTVWYQTIWTDGEVYNENQA